MIWHILSQRTVNSKGWKWEYSIPGVDTCALGNVTVILKWHNPKPDPGGGGVGRMGHLLRGKGKSLRKF